MRRVTLIILLEVFWLLIRNPSLTFSELQISHFSHIEMMCVSNQLVTIKPNLYKMTKIIIKIYIKIWTGCIFSADSSNFSHLPQFLFHFIQIFRKNVDCIAHLDDSILVNKQQIGWNIVHDSTYSSFSLHLSTSFKRPKIIMRHCLSIKPESST